MPAIRTVPRRRTTITAGSSETDDSEKIVTRRRSRGRTAFRPPSNPWVLQDVTGTKPTIGSLLEATDTETGKIYMYAPRETKRSKNCDLFVLDTQSMKVVNLTNRMHYLEGEGNIEELPRVVPRRRKLKRFPMIDFPSFAFMSATDCLVVFGGYMYYKEDQSDAQASSDLFLVDVSEPLHPRWWRQRVEGTGQPRMDATIAVVGDRIYIFGGVDRAHSPGEDPGVLLRSYSIIENDRDDQLWRWVVSDIPYPEDLPSDISFGKATPVYNGKRILLTPARTAPSYQANFTSQNVFYFCTETHRFTKAKMLTDDCNLPQGLSSYCTAPFIPPPNKYTLGNNSKYPFASSQKRRLLFQPASSTESVLMCGWRTPNEHQKPIPELWRLFLFPSDRILCLNIEAREDLMRFPAEFHYFTIIDRRIYLLGSEEEEDFDQDDLDATVMLLDACLEIPMEPEPEHSDVEID